MTTCKDNPKITQSQSHAAFTKGLASRWIYVLSTVPNIAKLLQLLEDVICLVFIPALTDVDQNLFALPCKSVT